ncbi:ankyrin repeat-containing domain protein [Annulohypoxylon truncatum]|uniref:ankyrin repeat-containing domain protein n=1 Tax=Annulohypoxylon truncatum TaxID=327061 RepID=UPI002007DB36|nr:ankyrin repeat-containing domain protein [Annulohypoxylon truncatum]KAI1213024.1 ankyrin repeat-containing domain protein [Annulohypoxylon truncatum]
MAARRGNDRIAWLLLQQGVDCNERDSDNLTPIMHGVIGGHEEVVRSLLLHGANIGDDSGTQRPSALHLAVLHRRENILRVLLNHCSEDKRLIDGYDDEGRTPLHIAISTDFEAAVLMLLQYGADPQTKAPKTQKTEMDLEGLQRIDVYGEDIE